MANKINRKADRCATTLPKGNGSKRREANTTVRKAQSSKEIAKPDFLDRSDAFFARHERLWFWAVFGITLLTSILLYDPRVSTGGDDSAYIQLAHDFLTDFKFPGYQGPLYPIMLSVVDAVFGMSLKAFKIFSMLSMLACVYVMYRAFRRRIPATLLFVALLLTSFNAHLLYFASQTYSEAFFMLLMSLLLLLFFRICISREGDLPTTNSSGKFLADVRGFLLLAVTLLAAILTRSVGYTLFLAIAGYYMVYGRWRNLLRFAACFMLCFAAYQLIKYVLWDDASIQASSQGSSLLYKDFYKPEYGREDLTGFAVRFWTNSNQYLSRFFMVMLGQRDTYTAAGVYVPTLPAVTVALYLLGLAGLWFSYKQNRYLFFSGLTVGIFLVVTFVILQAVWNQYRLIVPMYPLLVLLLFTGLYYLLRLPQLRSFQFLLFVPVAVIAFGMLADTVEAREKTAKLKDEYSGLTPDWLHYAKASAWIAENLPEDALVACRKPSISSVYGKGRKFYGIYRVNSGNFDAFVERWKADSSAFTLVSLEGMNNQLYQHLAGRCEARLYVGEKYYIAVSDSSFTTKLQTQFPTLKTTDSPRSFAPILEQAGGQTAVYYPDSLLAPLRQAGVSHILMASLRLNPNIKDGQTVNTVDRVVSFIQEKYPGIFQPIVQVGNPGDEPAEIIKINWDAVKE